LRNIDMTTERERMLAGHLYNARDPELMAMAHRARALLARFNATDSTDADGRAALLTSLLGSVGPDVWIEPPFFCDYGTHISIGAETFINVNCVLLDCAEIRIGANTLLGPAVQLLTAYHPLRAADRVLPGAAKEGRAPYRDQAAPIQVGRQVWLGAGTLVMPGVTIGDDVTIGAGSIVTRDIPSGVLAFGQPCQVRREL
jgi:maltose O-acetyltransferase